MNRPRALLSVYDKSGLVGLGLGLTKLGWEVLASGGTAHALNTAGVPVTPVESLTGFPELLDGRVKTLHPAIHAGILARPVPEHMAQLEQHGLAPISLVACNLYPFARTVAQPGISEARAIEEIDIGGVTLLRAAAKTFERVVTLCDPSDYGSVLKALEEKGEVPFEQRRRLALKAFRHTAAYDIAIAAWLAEQVEGAQALPEQLQLVAHRIQSMRYGENPHQQAALYGWSGAHSPYEQLHGIELSYNNLVDLEAAWAAVQEFTEPAVVIIKHTNPCGLATATTLTEAYRAAYDCDPVSAYGGVIGCNREVDAAGAEALAGQFVEVIVAPGYEPAALERLRSRPNLRLVMARSDQAEELVLRSVRGGLLAQTPDRRGVDESSWQVVTRRAPSPAERRSLTFAWLVCKHVKSNAIVLAQGTATVGIGGGQMNRATSVFLAVRQAGDKARGAVMASDAFFPFPDGVQLAGQAGVSAIIQPGGSVRDAEVIAAADALGMAMVCCGERHFKH